MQFDVEKLLSKHLSKELAFAKQIEHLKQELASYQLSPSDLFTLIDYEQTHYVDRVNLKKFLMNFTYLPNDNLLLAIIRRMDLDCDARLNVREFSEAISPLEPINLI